MLDVHDIDALLIGALYGELTPADEARLAAHLESHPTDRSALADMTHARAVVRESRILQVQVEPPQAISALLLQEAARRAPRKVVAREESEGWFHRFVHSFMSHPAMAAAAMLVLVVGVASTLYLRKGDHFADETVAAPSTTARAEQQAADQGAAPRQDQWRGQQGGDTIAAPTAGAAGSGSAFDADLADRKQLAKGEARDEREDRLKAKVEGGKDMQKADATKAPPRAVAHSGVVVQSPPSLAPRELPEAKAPAPTKTAPADDSVRQEVATNAPGGAGPANGVASTGAAPPPPAMAPTATVQRERAVDKPAADPAAGEASTLVAWAKDQHVRVQALVKAGKCQDAAQLALDISARAPDYYAQHVATDRAVKPCASYINDARDKEAEKSQKARAAKRVNANEPAPAQLDSK